MLRKRIMAVSLKNLLLQMASNSVRLSWILLVSWSSYSFMSYPLSAATKITAVTSSKHSIHLRLSDRCPPTSNMR